MAVKAETLEAGIHPALILYQLCGRAVTERVW
jgi:hypothetical protein